MSTFSVKAAYKVGVKIRDRKKGKDAASSKAIRGSSVVKFEWKKIWDLKGTNKLKMFVWRLAHNSLANRMKIQRVGVELDTKCPVCNRLDEDGGHVFLKCKKVKECWVQLGLSDTRSKLLECNSAQAMLDCLWTCEEEVQLKALVLMWEWWGVRNKVNAGESIKRVSEIIGNVERHLLDFSSLRPPPKTPKPPDISIWEKPEEDFMKVNFDGAFHEAIGTGGWGFIIRNHRGEFVAAGAGRLSHLRDPLHAETLACIAAVKGAAVVGARKVIFESDCSNMVRALRSEEVDRSALWPSTMEARKKCAVEFQTFSFSFCHRVCNSAAHELAKVGVKSATSDILWLDSAPSCVTNIVASDLAVQVE